MSRTVARTAPDVPLTPEAVFDQLCSIEKVFRLNPHWIIRRFEVSSGGELRLDSTIDAEFEDYSTGDVYRLEGRCTLFEQARMFVLEYAGSPKIRTKVFVAEADAGSRITIEETYGDEEDDDRLQWHRRQLEFWVRSVIAYLRLLATPGLRAGVTRWFMNRFWIPATPSGRWISIIIFKLSVVELVIIVAIIVAWALFSHK